MTQKKYHKLSPQAQEALADGLNPRSLRDEDYALYLEANDGVDPAASPLAADDESDDEGDDSEGEDE